MKIAYIITRSDEIGGAHIHAHDLTAWLLTICYEIMIFVSEQRVCTRKLETEVSLLNG
jgi:hypothetical protein